MNITYLKKVISFAAAGFIALAALSFAPAANATLNLDADGATLSFFNDGDLFLDESETHLYEEVVTLDGHSVDALLTVDSIEASTDLDNADEFGTEGIDSFFSVSCGDGCDPWAPDAPDYTPEDNFKGYVQYTIQFFESGTSTPVNLLNFSFYIRDIDTYQYIEVLDPDAYVVDAETKLSVVYPEQNPEIGAGNVRFQELGGIESDSDEQPFWVEIKFDSVSTLTYKIGQDIPGGAFFSVRFYPVTLDNPVEHEAVYVPENPTKISKTVYFTGDSAYLQPKWFKALDKLIAKVPTCATGVTAKIISGVKKAKSEVKGTKLAQKRAAILQKFLTKRGLNASITLQPNGKGTKALNKKRFAKVVVTYNPCN